MKSIKFILGLILAVLLINFGMFYRIIKKLTVKI